MSLKSKAAIAQWLRRRLRSQVAQVRFQPGPMYIITRQPAVVQVPCPTWTSGFARRRHVIKFVQVPCPSSCPSSGSSGEFSYPNIFFFWLSCYEKEWYKSPSRSAPIPGRPRFQLRAEARTWTRTWTRNLDKFYHVFSSYRATCPSSPAELGQGTWTTAGCRVTSSLSITPRFQAGHPVCLSL